MGQSALAHNWRTLDSLQCAATKNLTKTTLSSPLSDATVLATVVTSLKLTIWILKTFYFTKYSCLQNVTTTILGGIYTNYPPFNR